MFGCLCLAAALEESDLEVCEQALCLGKKQRGKGKETGEGGGGAGRTCRQPFEAAILPSCNYSADHLSLR